MEKDRKTAITNAEVDAMTNEELLRLAKTRGKYIDRWTRGFHEDYYCDRVLDVPHFLRRLLQVHPKQFTRILDKLTYPDSAHWSAVALSQGLGVHNLSVMERRIPSGFLDSALLLEVSAVARQVWTDQYPQYYFQETKCHQLVRAMVMRKYWLQKSHGETARLFYQLGWKPLDVMLAWIIGDYTTAGEPIDPDCAAEAAREDPETAVWLLDLDHYRAYFTDQFHPAYDSVMAQAWTTFLYCYCGWTDFAPLEKGHRLKRMNAHYQATLERCRTPDWARLELEKELRKTGLLTSETPPGLEQSQAGKGPAADPDEGPGVPLPMAGFGPPGGPGGGGTAGGLHQPLVGRLSGGSAGDRLPAEPGRHRQRRGRSAGGPSRRRPGRPCSGHRAREEAAGPLEKAGQGRRWKAAHPPAVHPGPASGLRRHWRPEHEAHHHLHRVREMGAGHGRSAGA